MWPLPLIGAPSPIPLSLINFDGEFPEGVMWMTMPLENTNTTCCLECDFLYFRVIQQWEVVHTNHVHFIKLPFFMFSVPEPFLTS